MLMQLLCVILISIVVLFIYTSIRKSVSKAMKQKETNLDTDLREFRESHAVASVIRHGALDIQESIVQKYERMCILDPVANKNDPCIPKLISDYQDIILGRVLDPEGLNIPSEELLDVRNPDYARYLANQSKKQRKASLPDSAAALSKERARVLTATKGENLTNDIFAEIVMQGVPPVLAKAALTEGKLNTYTADDWKTFSKMITEYLTVAERGTVESFVSMFDEQEVIFNAGTFEKFALFHKHGVPAPILTEIIRERITIDQAVRIVSIVQECEYSWEEGMNEILAEDLKENEAGELRKRYGWKG
jgi:hypothetical protein